MSLLVCCSVESAPACVGADKYQDVAPLDTSSSWPPQSSLVPDDVVPESPTASAQLPQAQPPHTVVAATVQQKKGIGAVQQAGVHLQQLQRALLGQQNNLTPATADTPAVDRLVQSTVLQQPGQQQQHRHSAVDSATASGRQREHSLGGTAGAVQGLTSLALAKHTQAMQQAAHRGSGSGDPQADMQVGLALSGTIQL